MRRLAFLILSLGVLAPTLRAEEYTSSQSAVGLSASQNGELLSQCQVFEGQFASIPEHRSERGDHAKEGFHHGCRGCHLETKTSMLSMRMGFWQMIAHGLGALPFSGSSPMVYIQDRSPNDHCCDSSEKM
jgi:hypothetical protein